MASAVYQSPNKLCLALGWKLKGGALDGARIISPAFVKVVQKPAKSSKPVAIRMMALTLGFAKCAATDGSTPTQAN